MIEGNIIDGFKQTLEYYILNAVANIGHGYVVLFSLFLSYVSLKRWIQKSRRKHNWWNEHSPCLVVPQRFGWHDGKVGWYARVHP